MRATTRLSLILLALHGTTQLASVSAAPLPQFLESPPAAGASSSSAQERINEGYTALNKKDLGAAQKAFEQAAKLDPQSVAAFLGLAEVARLRDQRPEVEKWLKQALAAGPNNADAQRAWGRYQFATGNLFGAEAALRKAAELEPRAVISQLDLGDLYLTGLKRPQVAAEAYRRAIEMKPDHAGAHNGLATALAELGRTDEAAAEFAVAARLAPDNPFPLVALARLYAGKKDYGKALETYDRVLKLNPDYVPALLDRGDIFMYMRREPAQAVVEYSRAVKLAPKDAPAQFKLASAYHALGKAEDADRHYLAAISADGNYAIAYNNYAALAAERKQDLDAALKAAKRATDLAPNVATYHDTLGSVYLARGNLDSAIGAFRVAAGLKPPEADHYYHLALALDQKGLKGEAAKAFKQALEINPSFANAADARRRIAQLGG